MELIFGGLVTALLISTGHWFPWEVILGRRLPSLIRYMCGMLSIAVGVLVWRGMAGDWQTVLGVTAICTAASVMMSVARGIDRIGKAMHHERIAERVIVDAGQR